MVLTKKSLILTLMLFLSVFAWIDDTRLISTARAVVNKHNTSKVSDDGVTSILIRIHQYKMAARAHASAKPAP